MVLPCGRLILRAASGKEDVQVDELSAFVLHVGDVICVVVVCVKDFLLLTCPQ